MSKRKKPARSAEELANAEQPPATHTTPVPPSGESETENDVPASASSATEDEDVEEQPTVNLAGDLSLPGRDDLDEPTVAMTKEPLPPVDELVAQRKHLRGVLEALVFASDVPIKPQDLAKLASTSLKAVRDALGELQVDYLTRGIRLDEVAGGWQFRTAAEFAPFVRDLTKQKPVRLSRAQVETLAIIAYRQPITRPEIDDVRGVDSGPVLKVLLERDLVRILGKRDEPGRPLIYGTTNAFLEFFGLKSLKDLPTLREFTELSDESRATFENELGEAPYQAPRGNDEPQGEATEDVSHVEETIEDPVAEDEDVAKIEQAIAEVIEGSSSEDEDDDDDDLEDDDDDDDLEDDDEDDEDLEDDDDDDDDDEDDE